MKRAQGLTSRYDLTMLVGLTHRRKMRRPVLLMFIFSLCVIAKVHCDENIGPILNKMNDLSDEVAEVKRDILRVEDKITTEIDVAKISLRVDLMQSMNQKVRQALAEVLDDESINDIVRSQVVSEVRKLKRDNMMMKKQLHGMQNSLRDVQKERDEYKDALLKTETQSRELKCVIHREETPKETPFPSSFTHSHLDVDQAISNLSLQIQSTKMSQDALNTTVRNYLLTAGSEIKTVEASVNATREEVAVTKATQANLQATLKEVQRDILSTKSDIASAAILVGDLMQQNIVVTSRFSALQQRTVLIEEAMNNTGPTVHFKANFKSDHKAQNSETLKFSVVVANTGNGYNPRTGEFTAPVSGIYFFSVILGTKWSSAGDFAIRKEGNTEAYISIKDGWDVGPMTTLAHVKKGNRVFVTRAFGGSKWIRGGILTQFSGFLLRAD